MVGRKSRIFPRSWTRNDVLLRRKKERQNNFVLFRFIVLQWKVTQSIKNHQNSRVCRFVWFGSLVRVDREKLLATSPWNTFSEIFLRIGGVLFFTVAALKTEKLLKFILSNRILLVLFICLFVPITIYYICIK